ncbi:MAG: hypothetical protein ACRDF4_08195 [Rhabdochlamydiaceae bacterium]
MDVGSMIQTLVATVIGGAIVIATNWISTQGEKKKAVRDWYEQNYITGGVDPLMTYFVGLEFHLRSLGLSNRRELPSIELVPSEALTRTQALLNSNVLTSTTLLIHEYLGDPSIVVVPSAIATIIGKVSTTLLQLRKKVLEAVPKQVNNKFHQIDLSDVVATFKSIEEELNSKIADNLASLG